MANFVILLETLVKGFASVKDNYKFSGELPALSICVDCIMTSSDTLSEIQSHSAIDKLKSIEIRRNSMFSGILLQIFEEKKKKRKKLRFFSDFRQQKCVFWFFRK